MMFLPIALPLARASSERPETDATCSPAFAFKGYPSMGKAGMGKKKQLAVSDYRMVTVDGPGPAWKRTIAVHLTGKVWVPGIGGLLQDAMFNGEPILEAEGRAFVAIDDILSHPMKDDERKIFEDIRDRFSKIIHSD